MPNWYTTRVEVNGGEADIKRFRKTHFFLLNNDVTFDFNTIIKMPDILDGIPASSDVENLVKELRSTPVRRWRCIAKLRGTEEFDHARQAIQAHKETGHYNWYTWANANWGTKWNACDLEMLSEVAPTYLAFRFNTAWGPPEPVLAKMREMYPNLGFDITGHGEEDYEFEYDDQGNPLEDSGKEIWTDL